MLLSGDEKEYEFSPVFLRKRGWKAVSVPSGMRLPADCIPRIVSALKGVRCAQCIVVVSEAGYLQPLRPENALFDGGATCYQLSIQESEFLAFNCKLGPFRSILTDAANSWTISCSEWYNLFTGDRGLVQAFLGEPIVQATEEFLEFASTLAKGNPDEPLMRVARHYAALGAHRPEPPFPNGALNSSSDDYAASATYAAHGGLSTATWTPRKSANGARATCSGTRWRR
jgi:hypothetical protein